jgi:hypothetical protein
MSFPFQINRLTVGLEAKVWAKMVDVKLELVVLVVVADALAMMVNLVKIKVDV